MAQDGATVEEVIPPPRFCKALPGYKFEFPRDHFSHACFRTEWWYFTGNLSDENGRRFGFELTFFREGVDNPFPNASRWRVDDLYLAHFAISDIAAERFFYADRLDPGPVRDRDGRGRPRQAPHLERRLVCGASDDGRR
jgi:predicted secreted hydrolase